MSIFDRFKKTKKEPEKKGEKELRELKVKEEEKVAAKPAKAVEKKQFSEAWRILKSPHITEKATNLAVQNKYIFKVMPRANKIEIKKAIQDLYGVKVRDVNLINISRKRRRLGKTEGWKAGYKKAVITLAEGEKIEIMPR